MLHIDIIYIENVLCTNISLCEYYRLTRIEFPRNIEKANYKHTHDTIKRLHKVFKKLYKGL